MGARISSSSGEEEVAAATLNILGLKAVERAVEYLSRMILDPVTKEVKIAFHEDEDFLRLGTSTACCFPTVPLLWYSL